jgi:hypothetical protein
VKLIGNILPKPHKVPKDVYQSKKIMSALGLKYEKIGICPDKCMLFWKEHVNKKKFLECVQSRFIEVVTQDGENMMTEVTQKQLRYKKSLIEELKQSWIGVEAYDYYKKQKFNLRSAYLWSVHDFKACYIFAGWSIHGELTCPMYGLDTDCFRLTHGGKIRYFDYHRRWLPRKHKFRQE